MKTLTLKFWVFMGNYVLSLTNANDKPITVLMTWPKHSYSLKKALHRADRKVGEMVRCSDPDTCFMYFTDESKEANWIPEKRKFHFWVYMGNYVLSEMSLAPIGQPTKTLAYWAKSMHSREEALNLSDRCVGQILRDNPVTCCTYSQELPTPPTIHPSQLPQRLTSNSQKW